MALIQNMEDLLQARAEAGERRELEAQRKSVRILVGMSSCGIAAGAADVWAAFQRMISDQVMLGMIDQEIHMVEMGCLGLCALEPVVQVQMPEHALITYGKVTPEAARRILVDHIGRGIIVREYQIENAV